MVLRSRGRCENPDCARDLAGRCEVDHWMGGSGRRRAAEALATLWALCLECHARRTANDPNARVWNDRFRRHCERHRYEFTPHKELSFSAKADADDLSYVRKVEPSGRPVFGGEKLQRIRVDREVAALHGWRVGQRVDIPPVGRCIVGEIV